MDPLNKIIPRHLQNLHVYCCIAIKSTAERDYGTLKFLSQHQTLYLPKYYFNIIFPPTPRPRGFSSFPTKILYLSLPYVLHLVLIIKISDGEHKLSKSRICLLVLV